jgi:predicted AlkP superfamily phosphohydrolase/phosphomutase
MTIVKCRYCHKEIDKDTAYSPAKGRYYCNEEHYLKHEDKKQKDRENYMNIKYGKKTPIQNAESDRLVEYLQNTIGEINEPMIRKQITKLINSGHTYKGIELTVDYIIKIKLLTIEPKYGIIYLVEKYYNETKGYWIKKQRIKKSVGGHIFDSKTNVVVVKKRNDKIKGKLKTQEY